MKGNKYISRKEHKLLLIVAFVTFILALSSFVSFSIDIYNNQVQITQSELKEKANKTYIEWGFIHFDSCKNSDNRSLFRTLLVFLTFFGFLALLKPDKFLLTTIIAFLSFSIVIYWIIRTDEAIKMGELCVQEMPHLMKIATYYDYSTFLSISTLLFWQISILLRMLNKKFT